MILNREHIQIMHHTRHRAAGGMYCGSSPDMRVLVAAGLMTSAGKKSFVPDEYFQLTPAGRHIIATLENEASSRGEQRMPDGASICSDLMQEALALNNPVTPKPAAADPVLRVSVDPGAAGGDRSAMVAVNLPDWLLELGERLRTQDNRITADPLFCVQEERIEYGVSSGYAEEYIRINADGEETKSHRRGTREVGIRRHWETITVAFTEAGANDFIRLDKHNHGKLRVYVTSLWRVHEMIDLRNWLLALPAPQKKETT